MPDAIDPDSIRLDRTPSSKIETPSCSKPPRHQPGEEFLKGPIPWRWLEAAFRLRSNPALATALVLWRLAGIHRCATVKLTRSEARATGYGRIAVYNALKTLESAGFVQVERHRGRSPVVTLLRAPHRSRDPAAEG